jgi:hypothetical protein
MTETTTTQRAPMPDPALMELDVLAGDWRFEGPARYTIEPSRHGTVVFDWSLPDGDGGWVPWMSYTMTRID